MAGRPDGAGTRRPPPHRGHPPGRTVTRARVAAAACMVVLAFLAGRGGTARAEVPAVLPQCFLPEPAAREDRATVRRIQAALRGIYRHDPSLAARDSRELARLSDGVYGSVTDRWLARFRADYRTDAAGIPAGQVPEVLIGFANAIARRADWASALTSPGFSQWVDSRPDAQRSLYLRTRLAGTDADIDALLAAWAASREDKAPAADAPGLTYYKLTGADLESLAGRGKALEALGKLVDAPAVTRDQLLAVLEKAGLPARTFLPLLLRHAKSRTTFTMTDESIATLKRAGVAPDLVAAARSVEGTVFFSLAELSGALQAADEAAAKAQARSDESAVQLGRIVGTLEDLRATPPPAAPAGGAPPSTAKAADDSSAAPAAPSPERAGGSPDAAPAPHGPSGAAGGDVPAAGNADAPADPPDTAGDARFCGLLDAASRGRSFAIDLDVLKALEKEPELAELPAFVLGVLGALRDVEYPTLDLFRAALYDRISQLFLQSTRNGTVALMDTPTARARVPGVPQSVIDALEATRDDNGNSGSQTRLHVPQLKLMERLRGRPLPYLESVETVSRKSTAYVQQGEILWSGSEGCGCVRTDELPGDSVEEDGGTAPGQVYGLFPFWDAGHPQVIDFSVISRVGYYALAYDANGTLEDPATGTSWYRFATETRRHGTRVDWILRPRAEGDTAALAPDDARRRLVDHVAALLGTTTGSTWREVASALTFGRVPVITRGDGVTLDLDRFPDDSAGLRALLLFHRELNDRLARSPGAAHYAVNVMFPQHALQEVERVDGVDDGPDPAFVCRMLPAFIDRDLQDFVVEQLEKVDIRDADGRAALQAQIRKHGEDDDDTARHHERNRGKFLVLLEEPTSDTKKALRLKIENCLTGAQRAQVLRDIVPVVQYAHYRKSRLIFDITYFDDNFGGVGLWPRPFAAPGTGPAAEADGGKAGGGGEAAAPAPKGGKDEASTEIAKDIRSALLQTSRKLQAPAGNLKRIERTLDRFRHVIVTFLCPNLWVAWIVLEVMLIVLLVPVAWMLVTCRRDRLLNLRPAFAGAWLAAFLATLGLFFAIFFSEPSLANVRRGNYPFLVTIVLVVVSAWWKYRRSRMKANYP